jgi:hypothetical protein
MSPPKYRKARRRKKLFKLDHIRRREIERLARHVDAADTEDLSRYLIIWARHNRQSNDTIWAIRNAALRMGRPGMTDAEASAISQEAAGFHKAMTADEVALELGVTWAQRQTLGFRTIGAKNMLREARREIRRVRKKIANQKRRRAAGRRLREEYEATSLSRVQPWKALNMSRRTWERHRNKARVASVNPALLASTAGDKTIDASANPALLLITAGYTPASAGVETHTVSSFSNESACSDSPVAGFIHGSMSLEARHLALGLRPLRVVEKNPWHREREEDEATIERYRRTANGGGQ